MVEVPIGLIQGTQVEHTLPTTEQHFAAFGRAQQELRAKILQLPPEEVGGLPVDVIPGVVAHLTNSSVNKKFAEGLRSYLNQEQQITLWEKSIESPGDSSPEQALKERLISLAAPESTIQFTPDQLAAIKIRRTHGGFAIIAPPEVVQQLVGVSYETATGGTPDTTAVVDAIREHAQFGFALPKSETASREGAPEGGMDIILVSNTEPSSIDDVIRHEEGELLGMHIQEGVKAMTVGRRAVVAGVLSDMASRFEQAGQESFLGASGLTKAYAAAHLRETAILSLLHKKAAELIQDKPQNRQMVVDELRGAFLHPKKLLEVWYGKDNVAKLIEQEKARIKRPEFQRDLYGDDNSPVFTSSREGRFMFVGPSVRKSEAGEPRTPVKNKAKLTLPNSREIQITNDFNVNLPDTDRANIGGVYKAEDVQTKEQYVVKEVFVPVAEAIMKDTDEFISELLKKHKIPQTGDIDRRLIREVLEDTVLYLGKDARKVFSNIGITINSDGSLNIYLKKIKSDRNLFEQQLRAGLVAVTQDNEIKKNYEEQEEKFRREAQISLLINGTSHPHMASFIGYAKGKDDVLDATYGDKSYMVQQFIPGDNVEQLVHPHLPPGTPLSQDEVLTMGIHVAEAVVNCHQNRVIHRDIKVGNVIRSTDGSGRPEYFLIDLGEAIAPHNTSIPQAHVSITVSEGFSSPEQYIAQDPLTLTEATDVFSLGCLLYTGLTGKEVPFDPANDRHKKLGQLDPMEDVYKEAIAEVQRTLGVTPDPNNPIARSPFADIILKALSYKPTERMTAQEFMNELQSLQSTLSVQQPQPPHHGTNINNAVNNAPNRNVPSPILKVNEIKDQYVQASGRGVSLSQFFTDALRNVNSSFTGMDALRYRVYCNYARAFGDLVQGVGPNGTPRQPVSMDTAVIGQWADLLQQLRPVSPTQIPNHNISIRVESTEIQNEVERFLTTLAFPTTNIDRTILTKIHQPLIDILKLSIPANAPALEKRLIEGILTRADIVATPWNAFLQESIERTDMYLNAVGDTTRIRDFVGALSGDPKNKTYVRYTAARALGDIFRRTPSEQVFEFWEEMLRDTSEVLVRSKSGQLYQATTYDLNREAKLLISNLTSPVFSSDQAFQKGLTAVRDLTKSSFYSGNMDRYQAGAYNAALQALKNRALTGGNIQSSEWFYMLRPEGIRELFALQRELLSRSLQSAPDTLSNIVSTVQRNPNTAIAAATIIKEMVSASELPLDLTLLRNWGGVLSRIWPPAQQSLPPDITATLESFLQNSRVYSRANKNEYQNVVAVVQQLQNFPAYRDRGLDNLLQDRLNTLPANSPERVPYLAESILRTPPDVVTTSNRPSVGGRQEQVSPEFMRRVDAFSRQLRQLRNAGQIDANTQVNRIRTQLYRAGNREALAQFEKHLSMNGFTVTPTFEI